MKDQDVIKYANKQMLGDVLSVKTIKLFDKCKEKHENPVVRAHHVWSIIADQLQDILGGTIYKQWFSKIRPIVITDNILVLKTKDSITALWIKGHYLQLVELLLKFIDKEISVYFLTPEELLDSPKSILEGTRSKINGGEKNPHCH